MGLKENIEMKFNQPKLIDFYNIFHQLHMLIQSGTAGYCSFAGKAGFTFRSF